MFVFERGIEVSPAREAGIRGFVAARITLKGAQYRVDGGDWTAIEPDDGLWDSAFETFRFVTPPVAPGEHAVEVMLQDAAGNESRTTVKFRAS